MKLGFESFTIFKDFLEDFERTLAKLDGLGFKYLEWLNVNAGNDPGLGNGYTPVQAKKVFADHGLTLVGGIFAGADQETLVYDMDKIQRIIDWYAQAGCSTIGLGADYFPNADFLKRRMETYNEIGRKCKDAGLSFLYHNHFHEQQHIDGRPILDQIIEMTDPELVGFDWDAYWSLRGLMDPVKMVKRLGGRIKSMHCKDFPFERLDYVNITRRLKIDEPLSFSQDDQAFDMSLVDPEDFIECGQGVLKWQEIVDAANEAGVPYMFVEQDYSKHDLYECLGISKDYMLRLNGITLD